MIGLSGKRQRLTFGIGEIALLNVLWNGRWIGPSAPDAAKRVTTLHQQKEDQNSQASASCK